MGFTIARIIAAILLFWALDRHPYGYYTLLRCVVCGVTAYGVYYALEFQKNGWAWTFVIIAVLFNPLIPLHLRRGTWQFIDLGVAILLLISIFLLRKSQSAQVEGTSQNISYEEPPKPEEPKGNFNKKVICHYCNGYGELVDKRKGNKKGTTCRHCSGTGWIIKE